MSSSTTDPDTYHPALEVTGSINVELLSDDELHEVEKIYKKASLEIYRECERYITVSALHASMLSCFLSFTPGPLNDRNRLEELIDKLPGREKDRFNTHEVLPVYKAWKLLRLTDRYVGIAEEQTWKVFCRKNMNVAFAAFAAIYECLQVRMMSEAIAEAVGKCHVDSQQL